MSWTRRLRSALGRSAMGDRSGVGPGPARAGDRPARTGLPATPIEGVDPTGKAVSIPVDGGRVVIVFLTSSCQPCQALWAGATPPGRVLVTPSPTTESRKRVGQLARPGQVVVMSSEAWHAYGVRRAPWLVVVEAGRVVVDRPAPASWDSIGS